MARTRVLLIEDNRLLREGIAAMLDGHGDFEVVAVSDDGDAVQALKESGKSPDVVLLDLGLEKANSLQLMTLLRAELPEARIIAMDILPEQADVVVCLWDDGAHRGAGTTGELTIARRFGKPVYMVTQTPREELPGWILGCVSRMFDSFTELKAYLLER